MYIFQQLLHVANAVIKHVTTVDNSTYLCNYKETMKRNSSLSVPLSLVFSSAKSQLNFHLIVDDNNYFTRAKVCKDVPVVVTLMLCAYNMGKVLSVV